jgi:hypothetical protein
MQSWYVDDRSHYKISNTERDTTIKIQMFILRNKVDTYITQLFMEEQRSKCSMAYITCYYTKRYGT